MDKTIEIDGNGKVVDSESKDLLMDLDNSDIEFEENLFLVNNNEDDESSVNGITLPLISKWLYWIDNFNNCTYNLSHFHVHEHATDSNEFIYLDSFIHHPIANEFYYTTATKDNRQGFRVSPDKQEGTFRASQPTLISKNDYNSSLASFRMMKLTSSE
jgi:hypothetical protein